MEETSKGKEEPEGGPMKWEAHPVRHKNEPRQRSWLVFSLPSFLAAPDLTPMTTRTATNSPVTTQRADRRDAGPVNDAACQSTIRRANQHDGGPIDETHGQSTLPWANPRCSRPVDDAVGQSTRRRANRETQGQLATPRANQRDNGLTMRCRAS